MHASRSFAQAALRGSVARGVVALYIVATLSASLPHHHGHEQADPAFQSVCRDSGPHWADHANRPDLSQPHELCSICVLRADHHPWLTPGWASNAERPRPLASLDPRVSAHLASRTLTARGPPSSRA